nr:phospholipase D beta 1-like [Tanacetum cinerariifolium]
MCMCLKDHLDAKERKQDKCHLETPLDFEEDVFDDEVQRNEVILLSDEEIALDANGSSEGTMSPGGPRFAVYIVIPMRPEGNPTNFATRRILLWQHQTMQMMYDVIYKALQEMGIENEREPQDYLNFFCLGTRESSQKLRQRQMGKSRLRQIPLNIASRRFMIHVNSKGMIVDDEFVILGSANINQRSLEGTRDTEIAMGAYQPYHTWARKGSAPTGQIYGYRMSLWAEHIRQLESIFDQPESLECVKRVRSLGEQIWEQYAADKVTDMTGHLLK